MTLFRKNLVKLILTALVFADVTTGSVAAQSLGEFIVTKTAEKTVSALPQDEIYWHVDTFATFDVAKAAVCEISVATGYEDKVELFSLSDRQLDNMGGIRATSIGPVPRYEAAEYQLQISGATAPNLMRFWIGEMRIIFKIW